MPLQKKKMYARFNVGAMMKARKEAKENEAIGHKSVQELRKKVDAVAPKKRRIETRVNGWFFFSVITCNIITIIIMLPYLPILKLYGVQIPDWHFRLLGVYYSCLLNDLIYEFHNSRVNLH